VLGTQRSKKVFISRMATNSAFWAKELSLKPGAKFFEHTPNLPVTGWQGF
jgi:hypothetical protein